VETTLVNPFYSFVIKGMLDGANKNGYTIMIETIDKDEIVFPKMIKDGLIDGILLVGRVRLEYVQLLQGKNVPFVLVDHYIPNTNVNYVLSDGRMGAYNGTQYLIDNGHRKIGLVGGPGDLVTINEREEGFRSALEKNNLSYNLKWRVEGNFEYESARQAMTRFLKATPAAGRPTAYFAVNDLMALGAIQAFKDAGLSVPEDASVMGFDNIEVSFNPNLYKSTLTTVGVRKEDLGEKAVELLRELIAHPEKDATKTVLPTELVIRETVKPVKNV
jgi:DNA-binding LacI/PurR family transcriptional regulator